MTTMMKLTVVVGLSLASVGEAGRALRFGFHDGGDSSSSEMITEREVFNALEVWEAGIVEIGAVYQAGLNYTKTAADMIEELYAFDIMEGSNKVLFKPTLASNPQFRHTFDGALSYFATGIHDEDKGFALRPYTAVRYEVSGTFISMDTASAMGNYIFTDVDGGETTVEFNFQYVRGPSGALKITIHHSSFPYVP